MLTHDSSTPVRAIQGGPLLHPHRALWLDTRAALPPADAPLWNAYLPDLSGPVRAAQAVPRKIPWILAKARA